MSKRTETAPLFGLEAFSKKAGESSFYIERMKVHLDRYSFVDRPHNHDFYLLLYITQGGGEHVIDFKSYSFTAGSFFLMTPGQVHHWRLQPETDGFIIFFRADFYLMQAQESNLVAFPFFHSLNANPHVVINAEQKGVIEFAMLQMLLESGSETRGDVRILRSYLEIILLTLSKNFPECRTEGFMNSTSFKIRKLEQLVDTNYRSLKEPRQYADLMNLSPSYLNALCKQALAKTLTDVISDRLVLEAKRLFSFSDLNVAQVSELLNFSNPSYFIRFFKKHTHITPEQFKESLNRAS